MAVSIAEYLGQKTDSENLIVPQDIISERESHLSPVCPFNGLGCSKMIMQTNPKPPVCSLRRPDNQLYIVCEHRLISTKAANLTDYQIQKLLEISRFLFNENLEYSDVAFKREVRVQTGEGHHKADFILALASSQISTYGPNRLLVEVQGGGETNNTGQITEHINAWAKNQNRTNAELGQVIGKTGTIQTNAWRRLQEQLFAKATTSKKTNPSYGFAIIMGDVIMDYICEMMPQLPEKGITQDSNWDIAFVVYSEVSANPNSVSVELQINPSKSLFLRLEDLFELMLSRGQSDTKAFSGLFRTLDGKTIQLD